MHAGMAPLQLAVAACAAGRAAASCSFARGELKIAYNEVFCLLAMGLPVTGARCPVLFFLLACLHPVNDNCTSSTPHN